MLSSLILPVLIGGALGAGLGYFGQCSSGTCPLTSTWWRGALYGAGMGLFFGVVSPQKSSAKMSESSKFVALVNASNFDTEVSKAATPVVVDFFATWCGPCKALAPRMDKLAEQYNGRIKFVKVDVDQSEALASTYKISGVPTIMIFEKGKMVDKMVGLPPAGALEAQLESLAKAGS